MKPASLTPPLPSRALSAVLLAMAALTLGAAVMTPPSAMAAPGPRPTPVNQRPKPASPPVSLAGKPVATLVACLGDGRQQVRAEAARRLKALPRKQVLDTAAALATGAQKVGALSPDFQLFSVQSVALGLLMEWNDPRAPAVALRQVDSRDPDVRERSALLVAALDDAQALPFLVRALRTWGDDSPAGLRYIFHGLDSATRMKDEAVQAALVEHLQSPLPAMDTRGRFHYSDPHDPPQEGDLHRCWLFKTDACLHLISRYPFPSARLPSERCVDIADVRASAALALAQVACTGSTPVREEAVRKIRRWLVEDRNTEHLLALYRALFMLRDDSEQDRLTAREMFTATVAPSPAWIQGLGAMVALFETRTDEPALRVVSLWRLKGTAATMRAAALDAMRRAHPEAYERLLPNYQPPTRP